MARALDTENLIAILGIASLPDAEKLAILEKAAELIERRVLVRVFESQDALRKNELAELLESGNQEELQAFFDRHAPSMPDLLQEETLKVKQELGDWVSSLA